MKFLRSIYEKQPVFNDFAPCVDLEMLFLFLNCIFHFKNSGFILQGGDPTGTGHGGDSIYGKPFKVASYLRIFETWLFFMTKSTSDWNSTAAASLGWRIQPGTTTPVSSSLLSATRWLSWMESTLCSERYCRKLLFLIITPKKYYPLVVLSFLLFHLFIRGKRWLRTKILDALWHTPFMQSLI